MFDLISRLVDKSLVVADEGLGGEPRYRLLETLRAYALDRADTAGELRHPPRRSRRLVGGLARTPWRHAHRRHPREIQEFHANLKAALDWSVEPARLGYACWRRVATAWKDLGRAGDAMAAADRLLTDANAELM